MKNPPLSTFEANIDPILLWILVHGGDPGPDDTGAGKHAPPSPPPISQLANVLAIFQLASRIQDGRVRADIQKLAQTSAVKLSQELLP